MIPDAITTVDATNVTLTVSDSVAPASKLGKGVRVSIGAFNGRNYYTLDNFGAAALVAGTATFTSAISPIDAYNIDTKMDDSVPTSGKVLSIAPATGLPTTAANGATAAAMTATACYDTANSRYATVTMNGNTNTELLNCALGVRTSF